MTSPAALTNSLSASIAALHDALARLDALAAHQESLGRPVALAACHVQLAIDLLDPDPAPSPASAPPPCVERPS